MQLAGNEWRAWLLSGIIQSQASGQTLDVQLSAPFLSVALRTPTWAV